MVLVIGAGTSFVGFNVLADRYLGGIARENLLGDAGKQNPGATLDGPLNILLVGTDYRQNSYLKGTLWRSDTIMVVHVPRTHDRAYLISFPRDTMVKIPPYAATGWAGGEDKVNAAFVHGGNGVGGYRLLARTLSDVMGIQFDTGAVINFYGFVRVVGVLGGVELCPEMPPGQDSFRSIHPPYRVFHKGCRHFDGHAALDYVRQRKQFPDGDLARMRHQQQFLAALLKQAREQGVHRDIRKLDGLIRAAGSALMMDDSLPLADLAFTLRNIGPENLTAVQVPVEGRRGAVSYEELVPAASTLFQAIRDESLDQWVMRHPRYVNSLT